MVRIPGTMAHFCRRGKKSLQVPFSHDATMTRSRFLEFGLATRFGLFLAVAAATIASSCHAFLPQVSSQSGRFVSDPLSSESRTGATTHRTSMTLHLVPEILIGGGVVVAGLAGWLYVDGAEGRQRRQLRQHEEEKYRIYQEERARRAYVEPKDYWTEAELAEYDGSKDIDGPILFAADGLVFNVYKGRNFYGPGGEYHLFAGRDATRFLAKTIVEEETPEEAAKPLTMADRAALAGWVFTFKGKYEIVGKLEGFDPKTTSMKSLGV